MVSIQVMLVEDHALVRAGIRELLSKIEGVSVVAESSNGRTALKMLRECFVDIILMDIAMPEMNGLQVLSIVRQQYPNVRVIMLSMHADEEYVLTALRAGAAGYLLKDSGIVELHLAIEAVANGQTYLSPLVTSHVSAYMRRIEHTASDHAQPDGNLTPRQREILQLIAEGSTTQKIAERLGISVKTVETHRAQLMQRLEIHDIAGLVRYAIRTGLIES